MAGWVVWYPPVANEKSPPPGLIRLSAGPPLAGMHWAWRRHVGTFLKRFGNVHPFGADGVTADTTA
jgi:hypothetical protein